MQVAFDFLDQAIKQYVTATNIFDKLYAIKSVVFSMVIATDYLLSYQSQPKAENLDRSRAVDIEKLVNSDIEILVPMLLSMANALNKLEASIGNPLNTTFTNSIHVLIKLLKSTNPLPNLLGINFKKFQETGFQYLLEIKQLLNSIKPLRL